MSDHPTYDGIEKYSGKPFWRTKEMTPARAKEVLEGMKLKQFDAYVLHGANPTNFYAENDGIEMHGSFTSDELEAIACWMRDPKAVVEA